jgi:nanoRNase/pAp phosphatase (c-di-AMP/oligoRNAs hydrolase)
LHRLERFPYTRNPPGRILIACHRHADVDAYCAAYGLHRLLKRLYPKARVRVAAPEGLSIPARYMAERLKLPVAEAPTGREAYDLLVAVDTGSTELLRDWLPLFQDSKKTTILIDHHPVAEESRRIFKHILVDERASSSSEIVARIWWGKGLATGPRVARALLAGIYTDSRSFTSADCRTLAAASRLCQEGGSMAWVREALTIPRDPSEAMARLKAAQRMVLTRVSGWTLATSLVGAFQASAARALVELGADVAAVVGESEGLTRGSLRSSEAFYRDTKIHLGTDVVSRLVWGVGGGRGGGHPTAASFNVKLPPEDTRRRLVSILVELVQARAQPQVSPPASGEA